MLSYEGGSTAFTLIEFDSIDVPAAVVARILKSNEVPYCVGMISLFVNTVVDDVVIPATA